MCEVKEKEEETRRRRRREIFDDGKKLKHIISTTDCCQVNWLRLCRCDTHFKLNRYGNLQCDTIVGNMRETSTFNCFTRTVL